MIELVKSEVRFFESPHGYWLGDKELMGITGLIHSALGLGYGDDVPDKVKNFYIPRAAEYGHAVHSAIETYDTTGERVVFYDKSIDYQDFYGERWNVSDELESYILNQEEFTPIANEYTVSDSERYASNIDNIWKKNDTKGIWLFDTKTNNLKLYPGGENALKEYLSWQLSVYAYLFERQNPSLTVEGLGANWLRGNESKQWIIERKPDADVALLLSTPWIRICGKVEYGRVEGESLRARYYAPAKTENKGELISKEAIATISNLLKEQQRINDELEKFKSFIREKMEQTRAKTIENDIFKATLSAQSTATTFDAVKFKAENPDEYDKYVKTTTRKGNLTIKLK